MKWKLIWPVLLTLIVPLAVAWFVYPETHLPPGFGEFPPQFQQKAPGFNLIAFIVCGISCLYIAGLVLFPKKYGFKGITPKPAAAKKPLPWWFYAGLVTMLFFWYLMWSHSFAFGDLVYWSFTPLWYGFILAMDGWVYARNNGSSLLSKRPITFLLAAVVSTAGWVYFEFYDYFVLGNWYYPNAHQPGWSQTVLTIEFLVTYSTITVVFFEWYTLFHTFPKFPARYQNGPKWSPSGDMLIWVGLVLIALMVIWPYPFFWVVWIGPFAVMSGILLKYNIWNPFTGLATGNWAPFILMSLASMFNGFVWEFWNHGSEVLVTTSHTNPNYWEYDVPYVSAIYLFSEMPLLGYFGYLPFGILVWQVFIWSGHMFGFNTDISVDDENQTDTEQNLAAEPDAQQG